VKGSRGLSRRQCEVLSASPSLCLCASVANPNRQIRILETTLTDGKQRIGTLSNRQKTRIRRSSLLPFAPERNLAERATRAEGPPILVGTSDFQAPRGTGHGSRAAGFLIYSSAIRNRGCGEASSSRATNGSRGTSRPLTYGRRLGSRFSVLICSSAIRNRANSLKTQDRCHV